MAGGQNGTAGPTALPHRGHQLLGALLGQAIICGAQTPARALTLMLEAHAPIGALDPATVALDTDGPEQIESLSIGKRLAINLCQYQLPYDATLRQVLPPANETKRL